jgi:tripartite-type tricarboxylate transporter receptor subunit TctC
VKILNTAEMRERLAAQGAEVLTNTPEQFSTFIRNEKSRWAQVVKAANLKVE